MSVEPDVAAVAALIGEPARAAMLGALLGGVALPAGELATRARITPQTHAGISPGLSRARPLRSDGGRGAGTIVSLSACQPRWCAAVIARPPRSRTLASRNRSKRCASLAPATITSRGRLASR